jgi:hypothetical protein
MTGRSGAPALQARAFAKLIDERTFEQRLPLKVGF